MTLFLRDLGELALLEKIRERASSGKRRGLVLGVGDDAAVFRAGRGENLLLATADMMLEGVHFDLSYTTPYQLGFKLVSVNCSDIYAMGARPAFALFELGAPGGTPSRFIDRLFDGLFDALAHYGAVLAGGDVSASKNGLALDMTVIGEAGKKFVGRKGAKKGDGVYVTGPLGDSACGLLLLRKIGRPVEIEKDKKAIKTPFKWDIIAPLLRRHLMPEARKNPPENATAMIDVSDGLLIDLSRLCKESAIGVKIYEQRIPVSSGMRETARLMGVDPMRLALEGGEDYELLYTAPMGRGRGILIGEVTEKNSGRRIVTSGGSVREFKTAGYQHFVGQD
ncbi:MAG: thiamine-phosphate kinase [Nitrospiraceae bacterium]|nr:thiamine-phosphate kinase [Nitrospiraceae bacterium]